MENPYAGEWSRISEIADEVREARQRVSELEAEARELQLQAQNIPSQMDENGNDISASILESMNAQAQDALQQLQTAREDLRESVSSAKSLERRYRQKQLEYERKAAKTSKAGADFGKLKGFRFGASTAAEGERLTKQREKHYSDHVKMLSSLISAAERAASGVNPNPQNTAEIADRGTFQRPGNKSVTGDQNKDLLSKRYKNKVKTDQSYDGKGSNAARSELNSEIRDFFDKSGVKDLRTLTNHDLKQLSSCLHMSEQTAYDYMNDWFGSRKEISSGYITREKCATIRTVNGYTRKNNFKNGYGYTAVNSDDRLSSAGKTIYDNTNEKGEWTLEREALHSKIIDDVFEGVKKASGKPTTTFMGGGPASGKSYAVKNLADELNLSADDERVLVDPDKCKEPLPEYDPDHPSPVHEESSALAKRITKIAQENGYNVLVDGTGDGSVEKMRSKIKQAREAGHTVNGVYVFKPVEDAIIDNFSRDRTVDSREVIDIHKKISIILPEIAKDFDNVTLVANLRRGEKPILIASGGGGKGLTIHNRRLYDLFLENRNYTYKAARIRELKNKSRAQNRV